jgi:protein required for attachment to host cells
MNLPKGTWILLMDGEKFALLRNDGLATAPRLEVIDQEQIENPAAGDQKTDRAGRFDDPGQGRSAVAETDWHQLEKTRFAEDIAERLRKWALDNRFDRLVIAADPGTLGALRPHLHAEVQRRLICELDKDLTNHPKERVEKELVALDM